MWRFSVQSYCAREERQVPLCLRSECLTAAFHNFYPKNWVFRLHPQTAHLPYLSLLDAVVRVHEKRPALPEKLNRASQRGKRIERLSERRNKLVWLCRAVVKCAKRIRTQTFQHFRTMKGTEQFKVAIKNYLDKRA